MNIDQTEIIIQYLNIETNYAVIINGEYGVGKTHFYKNVLVPRIKETSLLKDDRKKYTPVHISLFGFQSLEDVQTAIFVELYPILKNRGLKLAAGIGKSIIRGVAQIYKAGDIDKYIDDINQDTGDWLKYEELVICFDDLDRKSENLDIRDVFGFINSLVENQGAKILIIANEGQLIKDTNFSSVLREKVIGVSIQYKPESKIIYNEIIARRYSSSHSIYHQFLLDSADNILRLIEANKNNFRNLIFFLEHFKTIFSSIEKLFQEDKDFVVQKKEKIDAILNFALAISIEYKLGFLNSTNLKDIEDLGDESLNTLFLRNSKKKEGEPKDPEYSDIFKNKYFLSNKYYFFKSIFQYITGFKAFYIEDLKAEVDTYFIVKDGVIAEHDKVLNDLGYQTCFALDDEEYTKLTLKMLSFLDEGRYKLQQYITVFHFSTRFDNLLNFNIGKLKKRFVKGINKGKANCTYIHDLKFYMQLSIDTEFYDDMLEIADYCIKVNDSLKETKDENKLDDLFVLFESDFNKFLEKILEQGSEYRFAPFWVEFNLMKVVRRIKKLENEQIWNLSHYFYDRYSRHVFKELYPEKDFIIKLLEHIEKPTRIRKRKNLKNACLNNLAKSLRECEQNFN